MKICGIDSGKLGAMACLDDKNSSVIYTRFKFDKQNILNAKMMSQFLYDMDADMILMEKVSGRAGHGATQTFNWGFIVGQQVLTALEHPVKFVTPQAWQKVCNEGCPGNLKAKEKSMISFMNLNPHKPLGEKPNNNIVDAFLIGLYGVHQFGTMSGMWTFEKYDYE
jgi:hypothetical protein